MKKFFLSLSRIFLVVAILFQNFSPFGLHFSALPSLSTDSDYVEAGLIVNNNLGYADISFSNQVGVVSSTGIKISGGTAKLLSGSLVGEIIMSDIEPISISGWTLMTMNGSVPSTTSLTTTLLECSGSTPIPGFVDRGLPLFLSSLDKTTYPCVKVKYTLSRNATTDPSPFIQSSRISFQSVSVLQVSIANQPSATACRPISYTVNVANNYIDNNGPVVVYVPKPSGSLISGYTSSYNQFPGYEPTFSKASDSGMYTTVGVPALGVPADSIYRSLPSMKAGDTKQLTMTLSVPCGVQSGTLYSLTPYADSDYSDPATGNTIITKVNSIPSPRHIISVVGTLWMQDTHRVYASGTTTISYIDQLSNYITATENIFNPTLTVNFSNIVTNLQSRCGVLSTGDALNRISGLVGGIWSGTSYTRDKSVLGAGAGQWIGKGGQIPMTYAVDYAGCTINGDTFTVTSTFDGDNIDPLVVSQQVKILTSLLPGSTNGFSKGATPQIYQGDSFTYTLSFSNDGMLAYSGFHVEDILPPGVTLLGSSLNNGGYPGLSYTITTGASGQLILDVYGCINPKYLAPTSGPCIGAPNSVSVNLQVKDISSISCISNTLPNSADFSWKQIATDYLANNFVDINIPPVVTRTVNTLVRPQLPQLVVSVSSPTNLSVGAVGNYTYTIANDGRSSSLGTTLTVMLPVIQVNGMSGYLYINNVAGATANYANQNSGIVTLSIGTLAAGESKTITFKTIPVPSGITNNTTTSMNVTVAGNTNACGPVSITKTSPITLFGQNQMRITKYRNFSLIVQTGMVEYQLPITNIGQVSVTHAYAVDIIPDRTQFIEAYTNYTSDHYTYNCSDCRVYFAGSQVALPTAITTTSHFTRSMIETYFVPGTEVSPGVRHSTFGTGTKYVAFAVDDSSGVYPVNITKTPGFKIQDVSTSVGGLIVNRAEILADDLLPAITVPVQTTVFGTPGLRMSLQSDVEVVSACEPFVWTLNYAHDGSATNTKTIISTFFPNTAILSTGAGSITHSFNTLASIQGAISGTYDIYAHPSIQTIPAGSGTLVKFDVSEYLSGFLEPGRGGTMKFKMNANCANQTQTVMQADSEGEYQNEVSEGTVYAEDPVLVANPDLWIQKEADQTKPLPGEVINYTLTLSNEGPHFASGVILSDLLPVGMCYVSGSTYVSTPGRSIGEPIISGSCAGGNQQQLLWTMDDANTIDSTQYPLGYMPGDSDPIFINYQTTVIATVPAGTALINGAHTSNALIEDPYFPNDSSKQVDTPFPDPTITVNQPSTTSQGSTFPLSIKYKNNNRMCAESGYVVATLPNEVLGGYASVQVAAVDADADQSIYYHTCPYTTTPPLFDHTNPTANGWTTAQGSSVCYIAMRHNALLCDTDGQQQTIISLIATRPDGSTLPPGTPLTTTAFVYGLDDDNLDNNTGSATTTIPSLDLYATITGSVEGGYPGTVPGATQNYTIQFGTQGTQSSCDNYIDVVLSSGIILNDSIWHDFSTLTLVDQYGSPVLPLNEFAVPLNGSVPITSSTSIDGTGNTVIHFVLGSPAASVCLPAGVRGSFSLYASIDSGALDSSSFMATVTIGENSAGIEDTLLNNTDSTQVTAYRADLMIQKSALSDTNSDGIYDLLDSPTMTDKDQKIRYTLEYDNIGNAPASGVVMNEKIPAQTCYVIGSLESNQPAGTILEYSNDGGINYTYTPIGTTGLQDCFVTDWRLNRLTEMPAPAHLASDNLNDSLVMNNIVGTVESGIVGYPISLASSLTYTSGLISYPDTMSYSGFNNSILTLDINNDGYQDIIQGGAGIYGTTSSFIINNGNRRFDSPVGLGVGGFTSMIGVDINNDGYQDIIGTYISNMTGYLFINNGDETFTSVPLTGTDSTRVAKSIALDLDTDGDQDIFLGGFNGYSDKILLNDGIGGLTIVELDGSAYNSSVATGDMNMDGHIDIVVGGPIGLKIYQGDGTGGLVSHSLPRYGAGLQVADFNSDGYPDIIAAGYPGYATGGVYLNDGTGGFVVSLLPGGILDYYGISNMTDIGDIDGDGDIDMTIGSLLSGVKLYLNDGSGVFTYLSLTGGATHFVDLDMRDIDNDGDIDIVGHHTYPGVQQISLYRHDGVGGFVYESYPASYAAPYGGGSSLTDLDNDGYLDSVASHIQIGGSLSINRNNNGLFGLPSYMNYITQDYFTGLVTSFVSADFDHDGDKDIIGGSPITSFGLDYYHNDGSGSFTEADIISSDVSNIWNADLNNDGYEDIVFTKHSSIEGSMVLLNTAGSFLNYTTLTGSRFIDMELVDFNNDGYKDIVGIEQYAGHNRGLVVRLNDGFGDFPSVTASMTIGQNRNYLEVADLNGDNYVDIVYGGSIDLGGPISDYGVVFNQAGTGLAAGPSSSMLFILGDAIRIGDIDNDSDNDIVIGGYLLSPSYPHRMLINNGLGSFTTSNITGNFLGYNTNIELSDINNDSYLDIIAGYNIYTNTTTGNFVSSTLSGATGSTSYVYHTISDVNLDGYDDIIISNSYITGEISLYINNGNGTFDIDFNQEVAQYYGYRIFNPFLVDNFDNQGYLDLIGGSSLPYHNMMYRFDSSYASPQGSYMTILSSTGGLIARNKLLLNQSSIPGQNSITYTIYPVSGSGCDTGTILAGPSEIPSGSLDLGSIAPTQTSICVQADFQILTGTTSPVLSYMGASYYSPDRASVSFDVQVTTGTLTSQTIPNTAYISTITPETDLTNNNSSYEMTIRGTDLSIIKSVDLGAVHAGDIVTYTLDYKNEGPQDASGVVITDVLPDGVSYISSTPSMMMTGVGGLSHTGFYATGDICYDQYMAGTGVYYQALDARFMTLVGTPMSTWLVNNGRPPGAIGFNQQCATRGYPNNLRGCANLLSVNLNTYNNQCGIMIPGQTYAYTVPYLPVGSSGTITITARVSSGAQMGDILTNFSRISSDTAELNYDNNESSATSIVGDMANVYTIIDTPSTYSLNHLFPFSVWYGNNGNISADNTVVRIDLPVETSYQSQTAGPACTYIVVGNYIECAIGTLTPGVRTQLDFVASISSNIGLLTGGIPLVFTSTISTTTNESNLLDNVSADQAIPVLGDASHIHGMVYLDVVADTAYTTGDRYLLGQDILLAGADIFGIVYGPDPSIYPTEYQAMVVDRGLTGAYVIVPPSVTDNGGNYYFLGLNPGTYYVHHIVASGDIAVSSTGGYLTNGTQLGEGSLNNVAVDPSDIVMITLGEDEYTRHNTFGVTVPTVLNVATTIDATLQSGQRIDLNVGYANTTNQTTMGTVLSVVLDPGVVYIDDTFGGIYNPTDRTVTFTLGSLNPTVTNTIMIHTQLQTGYVLIPGQDLIFDTTITTVGDELTYADNADRDIIAIQLVPVIQLIKTTSTPILSSGSTGTYMVLVNNIGDTELYNVTVTDTIAPGCSRVLGTLGIGMSTGYSCSLANITSTTTNIASVIGTTTGGVSVSDTGSALITVTSTPPVVLVPSIDIIKTTSTPSISAGSTGQYMITVTNNGQLLLTGVTVTDVIAPGCSRVVGTLGIGMSTGYSCSLANITSTTTNIASVIGTTTGGVSVSDTGSALITVTSTPPVVLVPSIDIIKTTSTPSISAGSTGQYMITVTNNGQLLLTGVTVTDAIAPGCSRVLGTLGIGMSTGYSCSLANIMSTTTNIASVIGTTTGGVSVSDTGSALITVTSTPPSGCVGSCGGSSSSSSPSIDITKSVQNADINIGDSVQYKITVTNNGSHPLTGVSVTDAIAPGCSRVVGTLGIGMSTGYSCSLANIRETFTNVAQVQGISTINSMTVSDQDDALVRVRLVSTGAYNAPPVKAPVYITPVSEPIVPKTGPGDVVVYNTSSEWGDIAYRQPRGDHYLAMMKNKHISHRTKSRLGYLPRTAAAYMVIPRYGVVIPLQKQVDDDTYSLNKISYHILQVVLSHITDGEDIWIYDRDPDTKTFVMTTHNYQIDDDTSSSSLHLLYKSYYTDLHL